MDEGVRGGAERREGEEQRRPGPPPGRFGLATKLRNYFLAGVIVAAPIGITFFIVWQVVQVVDDNVGKLLPDRYNPETYLPFSVPGIGVLLMVVLITLIGMFAAGFVGRAIMRTSERLLNRMPVIRSIYGTLKQIFETVFSHSSQSFREVVLIEYPRRGIWAIGFLTGTTRGEIQERVEPKLLNIFLPTTPNPTSGFLLFVPKEDVLHLDMSVEDGIKMVISSGIVAPEPGTLPVRQRSPQPAASPPVTVG
ncbi:MAG: DUF502 domain-containing protein [Alphaproteobacteria bacterium]|nr:DUF502 domain-containing protein [Alphaproteobacteria bacterium]